MAWYYETEYDDWDNDIPAAPLIRVTDEENGRFACMCKELGAELRARAEAENIQLGSVDFPPLSSLGPMVLEGWRFPMPDRPFRAYFEQHQDGIIDIVNTGFGYGISDRVIDIIESIEPGVHQYLPFEFLQPDGSVYHERRWILNVCTRAEVVDIERSHVQRMKPPLDFRFIDLPGKPHLVVKAQEARKRALWHEWRYADVGGRDFASDALWEGLQSAGIRGWVPSRQYPHHIEEI